MGSFKKTLIELKNGKTLQLENLVLQLSNPNSLNLWGSLCKINCSYHHISYTRMQLLNNDQYSLLTLRGYSLTKFPKTEI